jgi:hypothetical protein
LARLPTNQFGKLGPAFPHTLQDAPVAQNQGSRNFFDNGIGKRFENHLRAYARRIPHGDGNNRFTHDGAEKISRLDDTAIIRALMVLSNGLRFFFF